MIRGAALLLTLLTGFTAMVCQLTWRAYFVGLLGSDAAAGTATLGIVLVGLCLGHFFFPRISAQLGEVSRANKASQANKAASPQLFVCGVAQLGLGAYALLFPFLFAAAQALSSLLPGFASSLGFLLDASLFALLVGPPAIVVGSVVPMLSQALSRDSGDATKIFARVYGFTAVGAFAGSLAAGYWMLGSLGLEDTLLAMGCVNLVSGAGFVALGRLVSRSMPIPNPNEDNDEPTSRSNPKTQKNKSKQERDKKQQKNKKRKGKRDTASPSHTTGAQIHAATALLLGFALATVIAALTRVGSLSFGASHFTSTIVVAVCALSTALGSLAVSGLKRIPRVLLPVTLWVLFALLVLLYLGLPNGPYWAHALRAAMNDSPAIFRLFQLLIFLALLAAMGPPLALFGAALPMLFQRLKAAPERAGGHEGLAQLAGRLHAWHTAGALLGLLIGGHALLYGLNLHDIYRLAILSLALAASLISYQVASKRGLSLPLTLLAAALATVAVLPSWSSDLLAAGLAHAREPFPASFQGPAAHRESFEAQRLKAGVRYEMLFYRDGPMNSVAVKRFSKTGSPLRIALDTSDGATLELPRDYSAQALAGILPALFATRVERAFVAGLGTGVTAGELGALESMREVQVVESSSALIQSAPHFDPHNVAASKNPKIRTTQGDAYRALLRKGEPFDVIVSQVSAPWEEESALRYSLEFHEAVRKRLAPGGAYVQSLSLAETSAEVVSMILRTQATVFPNTSVWYTDNKNLLILAFQDSQNSQDSSGPRTLAQVEARAQQSDFRRGLKRAQILSFPALLAHELLPVGVVRALDLGSDLHTLRHPRLGQAATRAFFTGQDAQLPSSAAASVAGAGAANSVVRRYAAARGFPFDDSERSLFVQQTCLFQEELCVALIAHWFYQDRRSLGLQKIIGPEGSEANETRTLIKGLSEFYQDVPLGLTKENALARTKALTGAFRRYYHHAAPFSRARLEAHRQRCSAPECDAVRAELELLLEDPPGAPERAVN